MSNLPVDSGLEWLSSGSNTFGEGLRRLKTMVNSINTRQPSGRLIAVSGTLVRADLPGAEVGELCELRDPDSGRVRFAEVVGIEGSIVFLAPHGGIAGLSIRSEVIALGRPPSVVVGDHLLGAMVNAFGDVISAGAKGMTEPGPDAEKRPLAASPPDPLKRAPIDRVISVGVRSIDSLLTMGEGQRMGIFGTAGGGKSTLMAQVCSNTVADVIVVALVGERGREVNEFVSHALTPESRKRTIVVVATSDRPSVERMQASMTATAIAEHFRDKGLKVVLFVDTVTRLARALREIGLSAGEPPGRRGFPPSVYSALPMLVERAGMGEKGSITAFYTVLVEGDMSSDPIAEEVKSLLDGHIILSEKLAAQGHYPAIDVLTSRSRLFNAITTKQHQRAAIRLRELYAKYQEIELLIQVGEYRAGSDPVADEAIEKINAINAFLKQGPIEPAPLQETLDRLLGLTQ
jgi:ATP synthase in type III secretion protein N